MESQDTFSSRQQTRVKLLELISRIVPATFFLLVVMLKVGDLLAFVRHHQNSNELTSWKSVAEVVFQIINDLFPRAHDCFVLG